jgi:hypothetical protein
MHSYNIHVDDGLYGPKMLWINKTFVLYDGSPSIFIYNHEKQDKS